MAGEGGSDFSPKGFEEALSSTQGKVAIATGVAVVGWWWWKRKSTGGTTTSTTANTDTVGSSTTDSSSLGGVDTGSGSGGYSYDGSGGNDGDGSVSYTGSGTGSNTNATWAQNAIAYLSSTLGQDPATVAGALGAYLSGQPLTTAQQGIVTTALGTQGPTPTQVPVPTGFAPTNPSGGTTTATPTTGGTSTHTISVSKGETQKEIITAAGETYSQFLKDNPTLAAKGSKVTTGQKVTVR